MCASERRQSRLSLSRLHPALPKVTFSDPPLRPFQPVGDHLAPRGMGVRGGHRRQSGSHGRRGAPGGREMQWRVVDPRVVPVRLGEEQVLLPRPDEGLAGEALPIGQALRQGLSARLGQQQQADDAQQGAAGEDDVVQEVALLVVQLHDRRGQHAEAGAG